MSTKIKRRSAERLDWERVTERRFSVHTFDEPDFAGAVSLLCIDQVREPLWLDSGGRRICVADAGHMWLQQFPRGTQHAITSQFDAEGSIVQWYIDICKAHGVDKNGVPWWDDLYLDIVVTPEGIPTLLDEDELEYALCNGNISAPDVALAYAEARNLIERIDDGRIDLLVLSCRHRDYLLKLITLD